MLDENFVTDRPLLRVARQTSYSCDESSSNTIDVSQPEDVDCSITRANNHVSATLLTDLTDQMIADLETSVFELDGSDNYLEDPENLQDFYKVYDDPSEIEDILSTIEDTEQDSESKSENAAVLEENNGIKTGSPFMIVFIIIGCIAGILLITVLVMVVQVNGKRLQIKWPPKKFNKKRKIYIISNLKYNRK